MHKKVIKGTGDKNILILSGIHGDEKTPIFTTRLLIDDNYDNYKKSFKKITILSAINKEGIKKNTRDISYNSTSDLNRMLNNEESNNYVDELKKYIDKNDVIIDIHSSPNCDEFILLNQDETTNSYVNFFKELNISYAIRYSSNNTIKKYGLDKGKISMTLELNNMNRIDYESALNGRNIIKNIILNIDKLIINKEEPVYSTYDVYYTYKEGLLINENYKMGDVIKDGDIIGKILNLDTMESENIIYKGVESKIICGSDTNYVSGNNSIYLLQKIE